MRKQPKQGELATLARELAQVENGQKIPLYLLDQKVVFLRLRLMHLKKLVALKLALDDCGTAPSALGWWGCAGVGP